MYEAVGKGISAFAAVEFAVGMCFASMLYPADRGGAVATINSARSFEAKMKMIDALADEVLTKKNLARWRNLSCKIGKRRNIRDRLAHWMVVPYPGAKSASDMKRWKTALVPPLWAKEHMEVMWDPQTNRPTKPLFLNQLHEFQERTNQLTLDLIQFATDILPKPAREVDAREEVARLRNW